MQHITPKVSTRLLEKVDRLFTGTLNGRITEVMQNARRAGATKVAVTNECGTVTVHDNGSGIEDFAKLLDLGNSGWNDKCEVSEDPAGVGIFSLAPRELEIRSKGKVAVITKDGWTISPTLVEDDPFPVKGTMLRFPDEPWLRTTVEPLVKFSGLKVFVDMERCSSESFISGDSIHIPELGCRIAIREWGDESYQKHSGIIGSSIYDKDGLLNFYGQAVKLVFNIGLPVPTHCLVDLDGEATGLRLLLPARTEIVQNDAFAKLEEACTIAAFRHIEKKGTHHLSFSAYMRGRSLGVDLKEASPEYTVGLLSTDSPEPVEIHKPKHFTLAKCFRVDEEIEETEEANIHLLAALGKFDNDPFVPVFMSPQCDGYSWAWLPMVNSVKVKTGEKLFHGWMGNGSVVLVDSITIEVSANDGKTFSSDVCMAIADEEFVFATKEARDILYSSQVWHHLGGYYEDGDSYDSQSEDFGKQWDRFWADFDGPDEYLRQEIVKSLSSLKDWGKIQITKDGNVYIENEDGTARVIEPPSKTAA